MPARFWLTALVSFASVAASIHVWAPSQAEAAPKNGSVRVAVSGMAKGQPVSVVLTRPGARARVVRRQNQRVSGLRPGVWRVRVLTVKTTRRVGSVPRGATVMPLRAALRVRVRSQRTTRVSVAYGTVRNPAVRVAPRTVSVLGDPGLPAAVSVAAKSAPGVGAILVSGPTDQLPDGLVARVVAARPGEGGTRQLTLRHVAVTDAYPVIRYAGPLQDPRIRTAAFGAYTDLKLDGSSCGVTGGFLVGGRFNFGSPRIEADIDAGRFGFGARASLVVHSRPHAALDMTTDGGVFCEREIAAPTLMGTIPVVNLPAFIALPLAVRGEATARTELKTEVAWDLSVGVRTRGSSVDPVFEARNPWMDINVSSDTTATLGPSVGLEVGLGVRSAASVSVKVGTALEFTTSGRQCSWDWKLGEFTAAVKVGPFALRSPSPTITSHRLWSGCGSSTFTAPAPTPMLAQPFTSSGSASADVVQRPSYFAFSGAGACNPILKDLQWSEWGPTRALATGTGSFITDTEPDCAGAPRAEGPVTVTLSEPIQCGASGLVYTRLDWSSAINTDGFSVARDCQFFG